MSFNTPIPNLQLCNTDFIYNQYKNTISELIAYIEVYEHDLPEEIMAEIAELFQMVACLETETQDMLENDMMSALYNTSVKVTQSLYKHAICLFVKKIHEYKKLFKKFQYKGVMIDNENFVYIAQKEEKEIVKSFSEKLKLLYKGKMGAALGSLTFIQRLKYLFGYLKIAIRPSFGMFRHEPYLPKKILIIDKLEEENLADVYKRTKELLKMYEKAFPKVISNGANRTLGQSIFLAVTGWIIPIVLLIPMLIKLFDGK